MYHINVRIEWNQDKNNLLKETRGVSFEQVEEEIFMNSPLDKEEQWYEDHSEDFVPMKNQEQLRKELMEAAKRNVEARKNKKPVTINLDTGAITYFKELAEETGIAYQNLMNLYLVQCAQEKKRPVFA